MNLHLLPVRTAGAAENMAVDFLLLLRYPEPAMPRFRHYDWRGPAFTFGFSQKIDSVRPRLPAEGGFDLCRRPTGGGIVDHRHDWTYTLVLPRGHALNDTPITETYRVVHAALVEALVALGRPAVLQPARPPETEGAPAGPGVCFQRAELHDVVHAPSGAKLAGAALKRNRHGLLLQGSIDKGRLDPLDWEAFSDRFTDRLAATLGAPATPVPWPEWNEDELAGLIEQYSTPEWIASR